MRVKPGLLEKQQRQRRHQQSHVNTSEDKVQFEIRKGCFERTKLGLWFLDDIRGEDIVRDSHLRVCLLRHHDRRHSEEARAKLIGKRIHVWGLVALPLPQKLQICKMGDIRAIRRPQADYSNKNDKLRKGFFKSTIHPYRGSSTRSLLYCRIWTGNCTGVVLARTERKQTLPLQKRRCTSISITMPATQK